MPIIVDAHEDIASTMLFFERNYLRSAHDIRRDEAGSEAEKANGVAMLGLPQWLQGEVAVIGGTLWTLPDHRQTSPLEKTYTTSGEAHLQALRQIELYETLAELSPQIKVIRSRRDLDSVLQTWVGRGPIEPGTDRRQVGIVFLMEGGDAIQSPDEVALWYQRGLRIIGPAWAATRYCGGTAEPGPLTPDGFRLLDAMGHFNMLLDTSHMAEEAFYQAVDYYRGPLLASHSNPRVFTENIDRHLSDDMIRALIARDGVIGTVLFNKFLVRGWNHGDPKSLVTADTVARAIDHVCQIAGDAWHAAVGTDFDGGFGMKSTPEGFDTVADLPILRPALAKRGYTETDIEAIMSGNWLRLLRAALP